MAIDAGIGLIVAEADLDETLERRMLMVLAPAADMPPHKLLSR